MGRDKITVTLEETLIHEIGRLSEQRHRSRSRIVEEAVEFWRRGQIERELIEGYRAMASEDVDTAESHVPIGREVLK